MKPCLLTLVGIMLGLSGITSVQGQKLVGTWLGRENEEVGKFIFDKDGYVTMVAEGKTFGGKNFQEEGITMSMKYKSNTDAEPNTLDLIIYLGDGEMEIARMTGIYKFINAKTLLINMDFEGRHRPGKFDATDPNQITFHRLK